MKKKMKRKGPSLMGCGGAAAVCCEHRPSGFLTGTNQPSPYRVRLVGILLTCTYGCIQKINTR